MTVCLGWGILGFLLGVGFTIWALMMLQRSHDDYDDQQRPPDHGDDP
jgi:hypothetical protein